MDHDELLVGPATVVTNVAGEMVWANAGVYCRDGRVEAVGPWSEIAPAHREAPLVDARERVILPGLINAHHHLYSTFARGMPFPAGVQLRNFPEVLEGVWWRLDRALDLMSVEAGAVPPVLDGLRWGTTTLVDHHASPSAIRGSLDALERVCVQAGMRASLCYEITDRNGPEGAFAGVEENRDFINRHGPDQRIIGMLGLHASFTVSDETLARAAKQIPTTPIHVHVAEDVADVDRTRSSHGKGILERLDSFGLLRENSLLVHGVHLHDDELRRIAESGAWLVHNPESNANNAVGLLDVLRALDLGVRVALGTDGMSSNMLRSAKSAFLFARHVRRDPSIGLSLPRKLLLENNARLAQGLFGDPLIGTITRGAPADLCVVDYNPPTALDESTLDAHFTFGLTEAPVLATISDGKPRYENGKVQGVDETSARRSVLAAAERVWSKLRQEEPKATDEK